MDYQTASSLVRYDKDTGKLYWLNDCKAGFKKSAIQHRAGDVCGCKRKDGRYVVRLNGKLYLSYRIAWLLHYGKMPEREIDHINGNCGDDRIKNLRECNRGLNQENIRSAFKTKKSCDLLGVYLDKRKKEGSKRWKASITSKGKQISLGFYHTKEEAHAAYIAAKRMIHMGCTI